MADNNTSHDENEQAFKIFMTKMEQVKQLIEQIHVFEEQHEEIMNSFKQRLDTMRLLHPSDMLPWIPEMDEKLRRGKYKLQLAKYAEKEATDLLEQAHKEWQDKQKKDV